MGRRSGWISTRGAPSDYYASNPSTRGVTPRPAPPTGGSTRLPRYALPRAGSRLDRQSQITAALCSAVEEGSSGPACDELMALVYDDLRRIAASFLRYERKGHSLSPTDLVHEAYTKLIDQTRWIGGGRPTSAPSRARPCGGSWSTTPGVRRASDMAGPGRASRSIPPPRAKGDEGLCAVEMLTLDDALTAPRRNRRS